MGYRYLNVCINSVNDASIYRTININCALINVDYKAISFAILITSRLQNNMQECEVEFDFAIAMDILTAAMI